VWIECIPLSDSENNNINKKKFLELYSDESIMSTLINNLILLQCWRQRHMHVCEDNPLL